MKEFYEVYQINYLYMSEGIIVSSATIVLLLLTIVIVSRKAFH